MAFFTMVYCLDFFTPTNLGFYLVGGWWMVGGVGDGGGYYREKFLGV